MPEFPRKLPHLYLGSRGRPEPYTTTRTGRSGGLPQRDRLAHADFLKGAVSQALAEATLARAERDPQLLTGTPGFYLEFEIPTGAEDGVELLQQRRKQIELVTVQKGAESDRLFATVFVPDSASDHFQLKIEEYRLRDTPPRRPTDPRAEPRPTRPKNEDLIARIDNIRLAALKSIYTDDLELWPTSGESVWWELWLRQGHVESFDSIATRMKLRIASHRLVFVDREVRLVYSDTQTLGHLFLNSSSIAEVRRAKDTPALFISESNVEQAYLAGELASRVVIPESRDVAICVLDTGMTPSHPLLQPGLNVNDVHKYDPTWADGDQNGHGTNMAGTVLYGDLMPWLQTNDAVPLTHCIESVKILPDRGQNEPRLYGAITIESVARVEITAPYRRRAVCLAVTSDIGTNRGRPSSWSASIDQLSFGAHTAKPLILISAGNIRGEIDQTQYPARNETESIENPAQAWNAITVGAFTEKANLTDASYAGWHPIAPPGDLCPTSRTSMVWERQWPIKPEILMEGGNLAAYEGQCDCPDDLGLLTTYRDPTVRHFDIFRDTSAATAMGGHLTGRIMAAMPQRWPETIRALIVHSAEWTPTMRQQFDNATSEQHKRSLLRKYGYGVPDFGRAVLSAANDLTLIAEDEIEPFKKDGSAIKTRHMNLHDFPWPHAQLQELGPTAVELRVTLSYFIEPNPGERGWLRRHRYSSHALRFEVKRALESVGEFRRRINAAAATEEESTIPIVTGSDNWYLGRIRNVGSIHSDYWRGTAAELAERSAISVYPIGGWWKENVQHRRYNQRVRYALIVSIRATNAGVNIYTPVQAQIAVTTEVTT